MKIVLALSMIAMAAIACNNSSGNAETADTAMVVAETDTIPVVTIVDTEGDVIRKEGQLFVYNNGAWVPVKEDVKLDNGIIVKPNGDVVHTDGRTVNLQEGERITRTGNFFDKAGAAIEDGWDATKRGVSKAADATENAVEKGVDATKEGIKTGAEATKKGVEKAADATKSAAKDVGAAVKKGAQAVGDKAKEVKEDLKK